MIFFVFILSLMCLSMAQRQSDWAILNKNTPWAFYFLKTLSFSSLSLGIIGFAFVILKIIYE